MLQSTVLKRIINIAIPLLFLIGITIISSLLYLHNGIASGDDYEFHLGNIYDCYYSLTHGLGIDSTNHYLLGIYAYNTHLFYAPLPHYFAAILMLIFHCSNIIAIKLSVSIFCFIGALFFYLFAKKISNSTTVSLLGAAFFIFCPYRMFCGYCRFAYAEAIAIAIIPVLFYGIYSFAHDDKPTYRTFLAIILGISGLVLSHPFTALSSVLIALIYMGIHYRNVWQIIKTKKGIILSIATVVTIFALVGFYFFPMLAAKNANLYRVSDNVAMWTTYEHVSGSTPTSANFSGFINIEWIKGRIGTGRWPTDQPIYIYLVELVLLVGSYLILALSDYFTNKYLKNKYLVLSINVVSFWILPLTFIWLIHDIVFYLAIIVVQVVYLINKYLEEKHEIIEATDCDVVSFDKKTLIDIVFLLTYTIVSILLIFIGPLWYVVPSIFYTCQFAWRLWAMVTLSSSWLFVLFLDRAIKSNHRLKYITPLLIVPSILLVATMSFREKGVALTYPEAQSNIVYEYDENNAMSVDYVGAMNEYMPQNIYQKDYKSEYDNSLYTKIRNTIGNHQKYAYTKEDYFAPAFLKGDGYIICTYLNTPEVQFTATINEDSLIQLPQFYYDGYQIVLTNKNDQTTQVAEVVNVDSLVSFKVSKGEYDIHVTYKGPMIRRVFNVFFYIGLAGVIFLSVFSIRELYLQKKKKAE